MFFKNLHIILEKITREKNMEQKNRAIFNDVFNVRYSKIMDTR